MKPIIMLDMDGVISDFISVYNAVAPSIDSKQKFHDAVRVHRIFANLPMLPNAKKLLSLLFDELQLEVQILSSLGTYNKEVAIDVAAQKTKWLHMHDIKVSKVNFVNSWSLKENYSSSRTLMIDDRSDVIASFTKHGGLGVLYDDAKFNTIKHEIIDKVELIRNTAKAEVLV
jgi:hypothetical protein